jgi:hypothetical protein
VNASTTNASRELGAVFGVAVLGALVNAHLSGDLTSRLQRLHIPSNFISIIINPIENVTVPGAVRGGSSIEDRVIEAAYGAFRSGLEVALVTSGLAMLGAELIAAVTLNPRPSRMGHTIGPSDVAPRCCGPSPLLGVADR